MSLPDLAGAREGAGALDPAPAPGPEAAAGAGAAAATDVCACSRLTGAPIFSPSQSWISSARMMMSLKVNDGSCLQLGRNLLSTLDGIGDELSEFDDCVPIE
jgi:hypothetical protein